MAAANLGSRIVDNYPASDSEGVPLLSNISITLSGMDYDESSLEEGFFIEGPDTDQYIGPGLLELAYPNNISQGSLDDFLESPGYKGIVQGEITVSGHDGITVITFDPDRALFPLTEYVVNLTGVTVSGGIDVDGFSAFSFTSGSGSIEEIPASISSSVLNAALSEAALIVAGVDAGPLTIVSVTPGEDSVQNDPLKTREIVVTFSGYLDEASVTDKITVKTIPATDHPAATTQSTGEPLAASVTVQDKKLIIRI